MENDLDHSSQPKKLHSSGVYLMPAAFETPRGHQETTGVSRAYAALSNGPNF
jgi:hypothetical protein